MWIDRDRKLQTYVSIVIAQFISLLVYYIDYMYPSQSDKVLLVLYIEYLLLIGCCTRVCRSLLFRYYHMCDEELVLGQTSCQNTARLNILIGVGLCKFKEHLHGVLWHDDRTQGARQQGIGSCVLRLLFAVESRWLTDTR